MDTDATMPDSAGTGDYENVEPITVGFAMVFNAVQSALWLLLFISAFAYAIAKRRVVSRAWLVFLLLILVLFLNTLQTSSYLGYAISVSKGHTISLLYGSFIGFFNLSRSSFLAVLMVIASGFCITRSDLGPYKSNVIGVPLTVLITGMVTDFTFFALQDSEDATFSDLTGMTAFAASLWFICSVLNLASLILAWMYTFEMLGKEIAALEEEQQAFQKRVQRQRALEREDDDEDVGDSPYSALTRPRGEVAFRGEVDAAKDEETVADRMAYNSKRKLLTRFARGVAVYLVGNVLVLLLPVFMNHIVQSTIQVLQFVIYLVFMVILLVIFRPRDTSPYLMVGFNEEDAEARGVTTLATGIAMSDMAGAAAEPSPYGQLPSLAATSADIRQYQAQQHGHGYPPYAAVHLPPAPAYPAVGVPLSAPLTAPPTNGYQPPSAGVSGKQPGAQTDLPVSTMQSEPRSYASASQARLAAALQRPVQGDNPFSLEEDEDQGSGGYTTKGKYTSLPSREK